MDSSLLDSVSIPGVHPAKQERSRAVMLRLVDAALVLLHDRDFAGLSVADLCAEIGVTVGSFYTRFESKEVFLEFVQRVVIEESRRRLEQDIARGNLDGDLAAVLHRLLTGMALWNRKYEGLVRASLRQAQVDPTAWAPLRESGRATVDLVMPRIVAALGRKADRQLDGAIRFAFQMAFGTFNNMVLVNPGPYGIHDGATPRLLARAMLLTIEDAARR